MTTIKDKYNIEESADTLSIQPYNYYKKGIKWYILSIIVSASAGLYFLTRDHEAGTVIGISIAVLLVFYLLKEILIKIPLRYTFDVRKNAVFQSNLIMKSRKLLDLNKLVIFVSENNDGWAYSIGEKKMHLVKNYKISEFFGSGKKADRNAELYENEILVKINELVEKVNK